MPVGVFEGGLRVRQGFTGRRGASRTLSKGNKGSKARRFSQCRGDAASEKADTGWSRGF